MTKNHSSYFLSTFCSTKKGLLLFAPPKEEKNGSTLIKLHAIQGPVGVRVQGSTVHLRPMQGDDKMQLRVTFGRKLSPLQITLLLKVRTQLLHLNYIRKQFLNVMTVLLDYCFKVSHHGCPLTSTLMLHTFPLQSHILHIDLRPYVAHLPSLVPYFTHVPLLLHISPNIVPMKFIIHVLHLSHGVFFAFEHNFHPCRYQPYPCTYRYAHPC